MGGHYYASFSDRFDALYNRNAVSVFFILSGFVIAALRRGQPENYLAFMSRRAFRLLPIYALLLILSTATLGLQREGLAHFAHHTARNLGRLDRFDVTQAHLGAQFAWHALLLQGLVPLSRVPVIDTGILGQAWSLSVEWQFYLLAPLVMALISARRWGVLALFTAGLTALNGLAPLSSNSAFLPHHAGWFAVGIGSYFLYQHRERTLSRRLSWGLVAGLVIYGLTKHDVAAMVWAVIFPSLMSKAHVFGGLAKMLRSRLLTRLGMVSYSTYLVHMLCFYGVLYASSRLHAAGPLAEVVLVIVSLLITLGLSFALYVAIERPGMDIGAKLTRRWFADKRRPELAVETLTGP